MDNETLESETQNYVSLPSMDPTRPSPHNTGGSVDVAIVKLDQAHEEELLQIRSHLADVHLDIAKRVGMEMRLSATMRRHAKMLDFGSAFDHGGEKSALAYYESKIAAGEILADNDMRACNNRRFLFGMMTQAGFQPYFAEWWHFNAPESNKSMISKYYSSSVQSKNYPLQLSQVSQPSLSLQTAYPNIQSSFSHPSQTSQRLTTLSQERRKISARDIIVSNQERRKGYYLYMFTLNDILQSNPNQVHIQSSATPNPALVFRSAHHDSRLITPGALFIARKGTSSDGHSFIPAAARAGALAALCSPPATRVPPAFLKIIFPDVLTALHATARARTQRQKDTVRIGITGSNGKTSTKDAVAAVLSHKAPTLKTYASYNHELGYPITLLRL